MPPTNILNALLTIQGIHSEYFKSVKKTIIFFIEIEWSEPITVKIINKEIPIELLNDIKKYLPVTD
jgi:hypothetical protein